MINKICDYVIEYNKLKLAILGSMNSVYIVSIEPKAILVDKITRPTNIFENNPPIVCIEDLNETPVIIIGWESQLYIYSLKVKKIKKFLNYFQDIL